MSLRAERAANRLSTKAVRKFYREGDMVRIQVNSLALKPPTKLAPRWSLPFQVKGVRGKVVLVENPRNGARHYVSHDFLKHCYSAAATAKGPPVQLHTVEPAKEQSAQSTRAEKKSAARTRADGRVGEYSCAKSSESEGVASSARRALSPHSQHASCENQSETLDAS